MYLNETELKSTYYPPATNMAQEQVTMYLQRANAYAAGIIGGPIFYRHFEPWVIPRYEEGLKAAVALAFECFTKGETAQVHPRNGNITEAAPASYWNRPANRSHQWDTIDAMLKPYAEIFDKENASLSERGIMFL